MFGSQFNFSLMEGQTNESRGYLGASSLARQKLDSLTTKVENHPDRQSVVGVPPKGLYSAPFGWKPIVLLYLEGGQKV